MSGDKWNYRPDSQDHIMRKNSLGSHQSFVDGGTLGREYSQGEWIAREDSQRSERFGDALTQQTAVLCENCIRVHLHDISVLGHLNYFQSKIRLIWTNNYFL